MGAEGQSGNEALSLSWEGTSLAGVHRVGGILDLASLAGPAKDTSCCLGQATLQSCLSFPSNKNPYVVGLIGPILKALRNLGLKRHLFYLKIKQSTLHFICGCDSVARRKE